MKLHDGTGRDSVSALKCELAAEVLRSAGTLRLRVNGWSMLPTIWPGETLVIEKLDGIDVHEGDVVLFGREHRLFVHRVVGRTTGALVDPLFVTQGDGMRHQDEPVKRSDLLGRVVLVLRDGGCIEPKRKLSFCESIAAGLVRRCYWVARILVELHAMRLREQTVSCQN